MHLSQKSAVNHVIADPSEKRIFTEWCVRDWIDFGARVHASSLVEELDDFLPQFRFEIVEGVSHSMAYMRTVRPTSILGVFHGGDGSTLNQFRDPEGIRLSMHDTGAGLLPVFRISNRKDFETFVQVLVHQSEPVEVPASMGSVLVTGFVNPARYRLLSLNRSNGLIPEDANIDQLSRDRLILISDGPYSGLTELTGLKAAEDCDWIERSAAIRLEHEACHYCARRLYPGHKFGLKDELIADFIALRLCSGSFFSSDFALFMGLENPGKYREGGRFAIYAGSTAPGSAEFVQKADTLMAAASNVEAVFDDWSTDDFRKRRLDIVSVLTWMPLQDLAAPDGGQSIEKLLDDFAS